MEVINNNNDGEKKKITGVLFVGFMFLGMGIGYLSGNEGAGLFIGMGVGFLASAAYRIRQK